MPVTTPPPSRAAHPRIGVAAEHAHSWWWVLSVTSLGMFLTTGLTADRLDPFMEGMHLALWILVAISLAGAAVSALRGRHAAPAPSREPLRAERA